MSWLAWLAVGLPLAAAVVISVVSLGVIAVSAVVPVLALSTAATNGLTFASMGINVITTSIAVGEYIAHPQEPKCFLNLQQECMKHDLRMYEVRFYCKSARSTTIFRCEEGRPLREPSKDFCCGLPTLDSRTRPVNPTPEPCQDHIQQTCDDLDPKKERRVTFVCTIGKGFKHAGSVYNYYCGEQPLPSRRDCCQVVINNYTPTPVTTKPTRPHKVSLEGGGGSDGPSEGGWVIDRYDSRAGEDDFVISEATRQDIFTGSLYFGLVMNGLALVFFLVCCLKWRKIVRVPNKTLLVLAIYIMGIHTATMLLRLGVGYPLSATMVLIHDILLSFAYVVFVYTQWRLTVEENKNIPDK